MFFDERPDSVLPEYTHVPSKPKDVTKMLAVLRASDASCARLLQAMWTMTPSPAAAALIMNAWTSVKHCSSHCNGSPLCVQI
jgi:hypothetical protein